MEGTNLETGKNRNAELVDLMFVLMFEILWVPPHDPRRQAGAFRDFEQAARGLVGMLSMTDLSEADEAKMNQLHMAQVVVGEKILELKNEKIISQQVCRHAQEQLRCIRAMIEKVSVVEIPNR